jgi:hypothetical protein
MINELKWIWQEVIVTRFNILTLPGKMATEVGKVLSWQEESLCGLEH